MSRVKIEGKAFDKALGATPKETPPSFPLKTTVNGKELKIEALGGNWFSGRVGMKKAERDERRGMRDGNIG